MTVLILGLALWSAGHLFPIYAPDRRAAAIARLGAGPYKALFALVALGAIVLMVVGYRQAAFVNLWFPPAWTVHLNNLLMLVAVFLVGAKHARSSARHYVRHPMLLGVVLWAVAHLAVNGDLASLVLFGGLGAWAVVAMLGANARGGAWVRPPKGDTPGLIRHLAITLVVFAVILGIHGPLLGVRAIPG
ncbi:MAG TPA: NnrU family protein [Thermohalobaculum sp.]|nr:NnrU family protein [Thermohalobaculum sp.]